MLKIKNIHRILFEGINCFSTKIEVINLDKIFTDKCIQFNENGIISESKFYSYVDFGDKLIYNIINADFGEQFNKNRLLTNIDVNWKFYNLLKNAKDIPCYVFIFNFLHVDKSFDMLKHLDLENAIKIGKTNCINMFKQYITGTGFVSNLDNCCILVLDSRYLTKKLVSHELTHYFQNILNINLVNIKNNTNSHGINSLQLTLNDIDYLFDRKEFLPHLYINVISDLDILYYKYYKDITKKEFINNLIFEIKQFNINFFNDSNFFKLYQQNISNDISSFKFLCGSYCLQIKWNLVEKVLKEKFQD